MPKNNVRLGFVISPPQHPPPQYPPQYLPHPLPHSRFSFRSHHLIFQGFLHLSLPGSEIMSTINYFKKMFASSEGHTWFLVSAYVYAYPAHMYYINAVPYE